MSPLEREQAASAGTMRRLLERGEGNAIIAGVLAGLVLTTMLCGCAVAMLVGLAL